MEDKEKLRKIIGDTRKEKNIARDKVSELLKRKGVDYAESSLLRYENGQIKTIRAEVIKGLSEILGLNVVEMYKLAGLIEEKDFPKGNAEPSNVTDEVFESFVTIPLYGMASAGNGLIESEESNIEYINIPKLNGNVKKSDFATKVKGDSMEPYYHNGDIIVVDVSNQDIRTLNGKEALIFYEDKKYLKIVYFEPGTGNLFLKSYNPAYKDIKIEDKEVDTLYCNGVISMVISMRNRKMI
jgi:putative lexA repressor